MDHVTALAQAFEVAHAVVAWVMIEMGGGTRICRSCILSTRSGQRAMRPRLVRQICYAGSNHRPSGRQRILTPCGRPQVWQMPAARSNRTRRLISDQLLG
jgi:hypothetical protein